MTRTIQITVCITLIFNSVLFASEPSILRTGTRALGLCDTFTALADDSSAPLWNSAGLAKTDRFNLELNLFGDLLAVSSKLKDYGGMSIYALSQGESNFIPIFNTDKEQDNQFGIAYGKELESVLLGAGLDYKKTDSGNDIGFNTGFISTPTSQLSLGMDFRFFFNELSEQNKKLSYLAKGTTLGAAFRPVEYLKYRPLDVVLLTSIDANMNQLALGTEFKYHFFRLRGGTSFRIRSSELKPRLTFGFGFEFDYGQINLSYLSEPIYNERKYALSITLSYPKIPPKPQILPRSIPASSINATEIVPMQVEPIDSDWNNKPNFIRKLFQLESKPKEFHPEILIALTQRYSRRTDKIKYIVKKGDTLWNITQRYKQRIFPEKYRDYKELAKWNMIDNLDSISPGDVIFIPVAPNTNQNKKYSYKSALEKISQALEDNPNNPIIINNLAVVFVKRQEFNRALEILEVTSKIASENPVINNNLGLLYLLTENREQAEFYLKKATKLVPKLSAVHCNLGLLYLESDETDKAISELTHSLSIDSKCLDALYNLAVAYDKKEMKEKALQTLNRLLELAPDDLQAKEKIEEFK